MKKLFLFSSLSPIILAIFICIFFIPLVYSSSSLVSSDSTYVTIYGDNPKDFYWPTQNYKTITSSFGYRTAPTKGASTYHGGIDIGAPQGTKICATQRGIVTFVGFNGANGYTVKIKHDNGYESTYGHVSPNFVVSVGDYVKKGDHIANVGPKYLENSPNKNFNYSTRQVYKWLYDRATLAFCNF